MKTLIANLYFLLMVFPKEISSFLCFRKPCVRESPAEDLGPPITISSLANCGSSHIPASQLKVGLDIYRKYVIGFAEDDGGGRYRLKPFMSWLRGWIQIYYIKLHLVGTTATEASGVREQYIIDAYNHIIDISLVRNAIQLDGPKHEREDPPTPTSHSPGQTSSPRGQTSSPRWQKSSPRWQTSAPRGQTSSPGIQATPSHVPASSGHGYQDPPSFSFWNNHH